MKKRRKLETCSHKARNERPEVGGGREGPSPGAMGGSVALPTPGLGALASWLGDHTFLLF